MIVRGYRVSPEETLAGWHLLPEAEAAAVLLPCNGSRAWVNGVVSQRPFTDVRELFRVADAVWWTLPDEAWQEAFDSHPRIGERHAKAATDASLRWSAGEQSGVVEEEAVRAALVDANRRYEERFRRVFLVCATGKSAAEMLAILEARLGNQPPAELREAAEQQRRITHLRLRKWLGMAAARCEDV